MKNYNISEKIIKKTFYVALWTLECFSGTAILEGKIEALDKLEKGTLGKEIAICLRENNLSLVPNYESHDLKHVLLDYEMTPLGEIRLQAFMLGNGNWSLLSILIFIYGAILLPNRWSLFAVDFEKGSRAIPIKKWTIEAFANQSVEELRAGIFNQREKKVSLMKNLSIRTLSQYGSFVVMAAGIAGMLFCFPFLWSSNMADLVGAGFPFIAGAILTIGGLINLSILSGKATR